MTFSGGLRGLRPPATFWQPFRLLWSINYMNAFASLGYEPSNVIEPRRGDCDQGHQRDFVAHSLTPRRGSPNLTDHYPRLAKPRPGLNSDAASQLVRQFLDKEA